MIACQATIPMPTRPRTPYLANRTARYGDRSFGYSRPPEHREAGGTLPQRQWFMGFSHEGSASLRRRLHFQWALNGTRSFG